MAPAARSAEIPFRSIPLGGLPSRFPFTRAFRSRGRAILRWEASAAVQAFRQKMETEAARTSYGRRGRVVEFCHAWIKSKLGLRQFHVRGLRKVQMEMLWACLTYNLQHWIRLQKLQSAPAAT